MSTYWRVFPWDADARPGEPFSPSWLPGTTGRGRFDLPVGRSPVLYVAESPEHAVAEALQPWRNRRLRPEHLARASHPLALVEVELDDASARDVADLCDPEVLVGLETGPDQVASRHCHLTQPIARAVWDAGHTGLRWWSAFWGDWHGVVLFTARLESRLSFVRPAVLATETAAVQAAADALGMAR